MNVVALFHEEQTPKGNRTKFQNMAIFGIFSICALFFPIAITCFGFFWLFEDMRGIAVLGGGLWFLVADLQLLRWHLKYLESRMVVTVTATQIDIRQTFGEISEKFIIETSQIKNYMCGSKPAIGYGPGQIRGWKGRVFGFVGKGVSLELADGKRVFIATNQASELITAISQMKTHIPLSPPPRPFDRYPPE